LAALPPEEREGEVRLMVRMFACRGAMAVLVLAAAVCLAAGLPAINVRTVSFEEGYTPLFGQGNILRSADDRTVSLLLDRTTGTQ
jgi:xyloglucan:xyloglucosyl transferase